MKRTRSRTARAVLLAGGIVLTITSTATAATDPASWTASDQSAAVLDGWTATDQTDTRLTKAEQRKASTSRRTRTAQKQGRRAQRAAGFRARQTCRPVRGGIWKAGDGDTLDLIAHCTGLTADQLRTWNPGLIRGDTVYKGSRLAVSRRAAAQAAEQREQTASGTAGGGSW